MIRSFIFLSLNSMKGTDSMNLSDMNIEVFRLINDLGKEHTVLNQVMIFIAEYMAYFLVAGVLVFWFIRGNHNRMFVVCGVATLLLAEICGQTAGKLHSNKQPFAELENVNQLIEKAVDNSFPSDHTILFFSFCASFWLFNRGWGLLLIGVASLVGVSRIWVGVHYPGDILAAAILSIFSAIFVYKIVPKLHMTHKLLDFFRICDRMLLTIVSKPKGN